MRFASTVSDALIQRYALRSDAAPRLVLAISPTASRAARELIFTGQPAWRGACESRCRSSRAGSTPGSAANLRRLVLLARNRGASPLVIHFLRENRRMHGLARKFGMHLTFNGGEVTGSLLPTWPTYLTVLGEWAQDGHAAFAHLAARHQASVLERH